jgi:hypothetical protein
LKNWSKFSPEELERRRKSSVEALKEINQEKFDQEYQKRCDTLYWTHGKCCAGCDHWASDRGRIGECLASGIVSGEDVMKSAGISNSSIAFAPGFILRTDTDYCGKFKDEFDWSELPEDYLKSIGALKDGTLKSKPSHINPLT